MRHLTPGVIGNSQDSESNQGSIRSWRDTGHVVYLYNGIAFILPDRKQSVLTTWIDTEVTKRSHPGTEKQTLHALTYSHRV